MLGFSQISTSARPAHQPWPRPARYQAATKAPNTMTETWPMKRLMNPTADRAAQAAPSQARLGRQPSTAKTVNEAATSTSNRRVV